jgi:hypothetical protein
MGADLIVAFQLGEDDRVYYFASEHSVSAAGEELAKAIASCLGSHVEGRANAILKETRAPAAVISRAALDEKTGTGVADGIAGFFQAAAAMR